MNGTTLLETWSLYNDRRPLLIHLKECLEKEGFILKARNLEGFIKKNVETGKNKYIYQLIVFMMKFIEQYKTTGYNEDGFSVLRQKTDNPRTLLFLDIARQRFNLTKRLSEITKAKVVAVGDDWQSIYAFSGSDITLFTRFLELMGAGTELKNTHTYHNSQELIDIAGNFVQKNSAQIRKQLLSPKRLKNPIALEVFDDRFKSMKALAETEMIGNIITEYGESGSILLIGRYNFDKNNLCRTGQFKELPGEYVQSIRYPKAKISFMTAAGLGLNGRGEEVCLWRVSRGVISPVTSRNSGQKQKES